MTFHAPNIFRVRDGFWESKDLDGNNGLFDIGKFLVQSSNKDGWEHVSVTLKDSTATPSWENMCYIKNLFWDAEDVVIQYHPKQSEYINLHPGCLHLWRPIDQEIPRPDPSLVSFRKEE